MYRKILVPYDDSEPAQHALSSALDLASGVDGAEVTVLKVVNWHDYNAETFRVSSKMSTNVIAASDQDLISEIDSRAQREEVDSVKRMIEPLIGAFPVEVAVATGSPHDTIVAFASANDYDVIVMGHRGMGLVRGMLGSVAFSVLQKADKPVLVVK